MSELRELWAGPHGFYRRMQALETAVLEAAVHKETVLPTPLLHPIKNGQAQPESFSFLLCLPILYFRSCQPQPTFSRNF